MYAFIHAFTISLAATDPETSGTRTIHVRIYSCIIYLDAADPETC